MVADIPLVKTFYVFSKGAFSSEIRTSKKFRDEASSNLLHFNGRLTRALLFIQSEDYWIFFDGLTGFVVAWMVP